MAFHVFNVVFGQIKRKQDNIIKVNIFRDLTFKLALDLMKERAIIR